MCSGQRMGIWVTYCGRAASLEAAIWVVVYTVIGPSGMAELAELGDALGNPITARVTVADGVSTVTQRRLRTSLVRCDALTAKRPMPLPMVQIYTIPKRPLGYRCFRFATMR